MKPAEPGQIGELDTFYVALGPSKDVKRFSASVPIAKWTVAKAFARARASSAARFLDTLAADMPFPIQPIQVDGGSQLSRWNRAFGARPSSTKPAKRVRSSSLWSRPKAPK